MKKDLQKILGIKIKNEDLFKEAFTHKSFINENRRNNFSCNERLEFLGDAVLELLTTDFLFAYFPRKEEGELTAFRSALVCGKNLAKIALVLDLGKFLFISKGEEKSGGRNKNYILANTFEAVLGAIYLDSGLKNCQKILEKFLFPKINQIVEENLHKDAKSLLQELAQEKKAITPHFEVLSQVGPDHAKIFEVGAFLAQKCVGKGKGSSKQKASNEAAKNALVNLNWQA